MREILFIGTFVKCESAMNMHTSMYSHKHWYHMCLHDLYESFLWAENWKKKERGFWQRNSKYDFLHKAYRKMSSCCGGSKGQYAKQPAAWTWMFTMWYFFNTEDQPAYSSVNLNSSRKEKEHLSHIPCSYVTKCKGKRGCSSSVFYQQHQQNLNKIHRRIQRPLHTLRNLMIFFLFFLHQKCLWLTSTNVRISQ